MSKTYSQSRTGVTPESTSGPPLRAGVLQRKCACGTHTAGGGECDECGKQRKLRRRSARADERGMTQEVPAVVHEVLRSAGQPLDARTRSFMEPRFGHDFSRVQTISPQRSAGGLEVGPQGDRFEQEADRFAQKILRAPAPGEHGGAGPLRRQDFSRIRVHADARAAESARAVGALAYTVGDHLVFGAGQYAPETDAGKRLLAHELTHAVQQGGSQSSVQRACDPTAAPLSTRTRPVFFPNDRTYRSIFRGATTLKESPPPTPTPTPSPSPSPTPTPAPTSAPPPDPVVGHVQQALVDLGFSLGTTGPNGDGVDGIFGATTTAAVTAFQTAQGIPGATHGEVDAPTLKCLDEQRAHVAVAPHLTPNVQPADVQIKDQEIGGRDEDIFFNRGSATLSEGGKRRIGRLLTRSTDPLQGCSVTLEGFTSEDELVEFGPGLADDRINAVSAEFAAQKHDDPGPACKRPVRPLRTPSPLPAESSAVSSYRARRKVEVVPAGKRSTTTPCPRTAPQFRALTGPESRALKEAVKLAVGWMNTAIGKLAPGDAKGEEGLKAYFGGTGRRGDIEAKLVAWRDHLRDVVSVNHRRGTDCNDSCRSAIAFNEGTGSAAQMTVCQSLFEPLAFHPSLNTEQNRAFIIMHEAGHGSIGTKDTAYGHTRLIEFLANYPDIAETNTDSFTMMVLCLKGFPGFCAPPRTGNASVGMDDAEKANARRGLSWLQTWLMWAGGDASQMYVELDDARKSGDSTRSMSFPSAIAFIALADAFKLRRPPGHPPPTFSEQTFAAAVSDRLLHMRDATFKWLEIKKDTGATPRDRWSQGPGPEVFLTDAYFKLADDRARVETMLPLILRAEPRVSIALEKNYETFIRENVKSNHDDKP